MGDHASRGRRLSDVTAAADLFPAREIEPELAEAGRLLFAQDCRFIAGAAEADALPPETLPEIALRFCLSHRAVTSVIPGMRRISTVESSCRAAAAGALDAKTIGSDFKVDLVPLLREELILVTPVRALCRPDCAGLCPVCGIDLNERPHTHDDAVDARWTALQELRDKIAPD